MTVEMDPDKCCLSKQDYSIKKRWV